MLVDQIKNFVDDLSTQESALLVNNNAIAYSKVELEGDTVHWVSNELDQSEYLIQLQSAQMQLGQESRLAALSVSTQLLNTLIK